MAKAAWPSSPALEEIRVWGQPCAVHRGTWGPGDFGCGHENKTSPWACRKAGALQLLSLHLAAALLFTFLEVQDLQPCKLMLGLGYMLIKVVVSKGSWVRVVAALINPCLGGMAGSQRVTDCPASCHAFRHSGVRTDTTLSKERVKHKLCISGMPDFSSLQLWAGSSSSQGGRQGAVRAEFFFIYLFF